MLDGLGGETVSKEILLQFLEDGGIDLIKACISDRALEMIVVPVLISYGTFLIIFEPLYVAVRDGFE